MNPGLTADRLLEIRERIVTALDELEQDDPGTCRFYLDGLLADLDQAVADHPPSTDESVWVP